MSPACPWCAEDDAVIEAEYAITGHATAVVLYVCADDLGLGVEQVLRAEGEEHARVERVVAPSSSPAPEEST